MATFFSNKSFNLESLTIVSSSGSKSSIDVSTIMGELTLFEDLYSPTMSGSVVILDGMNLLEGLPIFGFEYITIQLSKPGYEKDKSAIIDKVFRIYKISEFITNETTFAAQGYKIHFCSEELMLATSVQVFKSYKGRPVTDIIKDVTTNYLKISSEKLPASAIDITKDRFDLIVPGLHVLEAIQWVTLRTTPPSFFFETNKGFEFRSLDSLKNRTPIATYRFEPVNVGKPEYSLQEGKIIRYEIISLFDTLYASQFDMYSSIVGTVDPILQTYDEVNFDYTDAFDKDKHFSEGKAYPLYSKAKTRLNKDLESLVDMSKLMITNKDHHINPDIVRYQPGINPAQVEKWVANKVSTLEQMHQLRIKLVVPGNPKLKVGDSLSVYLPSFTTKNDTDNTSKRFSGKYLIAAIRHKITFDSYEMIMEVVKDCVETEYPAPADNDSTLQELKKK